MSKSKIEINDISPEDLLNGVNFNCEAEFKAYGMGGVNAFMPDATAVKDLPHREGGEMKAMWKHPKKTATLAKLGIHPVPKEAVDPRFNGGRPIVIGSPSWRVDENGWIVRGNGRVRLFWTTAKNQALLAAADKRAVQHQKFGRKHDQISPVEPNTGMKQVAHGLSAFSEDSRYVPEDEGGPRIQLD